MYGFYGEYLGVRIARKHIGWYCRERVNSKAMLVLVNQAQSCRDQLRIISEFFQADAELGLAA